MEYRARVCDIALRPYVRFSLTRKKYQLPGGTVYHPEELSIRVEQFERLRYLRYVLDNVVKYFVYACTHAVQRAAARQRWGLASRLTVVAVVPAI